MRRKLLAGSTLTAGLLCAWASVASPPSSLYGLTWEETFPGTSIDTSRWNFRTDVKLLSAQLPANAAVTADHRLSILMKKESVSGMNYTGGGIVSKQVFGYGYYEVIARTTANQGWHNSFWMMRGDGSDTLGAGRYLEIDSFEINTQTPSTILSGLQIWNGQAGSEPLPSPRCDDLTNFDSSAAFHTYGADWREGAIDFYVDGTKYCTTAYATDIYRQDPVNIWLTAIAYQYPVTVGGTPQLFDRVRFYTRDQYVLASYSGYTESGSGWTDSTLPGFGLIPQRYSCADGSSSTFAPSFQQAGTYHVYIWKTVSANADTSADVAINTGGTTTHTAVDFSAGTTGWYDLGTFAFRTGATGSITNTRGNNCTRASAVKFVRDTSSVEP